MTRHIFNNAPEAETAERFGSLDALCNFRIFHFLGTAGITGSLAGWIKSIAGRIATWADTCFDHWAAAAMYDQLSRLSDVELQRRGLSRATLARDIGDASDTTTRLSAAVESSESSQPSQTASNTP